MALEREMIDAQNTYIKLQQDIQELNIKRSSLQNEIEAKLKETDEKIKLIYAEHQEKIKEGVEELDKLTQRTKENADKINAEISTKSVEVEAEWKRIEDEVRDLEKEKSDFEEYKKTEKKKLEDNFSYLTKEAENNTLRAQELDKVSKQQADTKYELDNLKFQADYSIDENKKLLNEIIVQQTKVDEKYQTVRKEREGITSEKDIILVKLEELKGQEEELRQLASLKDDIAKLEALKIEVETKIKQNEELSKSFAKKKEELDEKEQTLNEKQRLLILDMRKNDDKITTIQKLRDEMKKNA